MGSERIHFEALVGDSLSRIGKEIAKKHIGIPTPFPTWNELSGEEGGHEGVALGWFVVVGGADGAGKSYLTINHAANAVLQGHKVGVINFEMSEAGFTQRYLSILSGHPKYRLEHGKFFDRDAWQAASDYAESVYDETGGILITNDHGVFSIEDIAVAYEKLVAQGCTLIIVDYAQLVTVNGQDGIFGRTEVVANELRVLTHKHHVQTVAVSQLNREGKKLTSPPTRHYLQGGGAWENNCNQIVLIDHTMKVIDWDERVIYTRLIMDKNRHGPSPVTWGVRWDLQNMQWVEADMPAAVDMNGAQGDPDDDPETTQNEGGGPPHHRYHPHDEHFGKQEDLPFPEED